MGRFGKSSRGRTRKILLLNPPGRKNYGRDYFLGGELEPQLRLPPLDLVCLSGILSLSGELLVIDALAEELSAAETLSRAGRYSPQYIFFLISAASYAEDVEFLRELKTRFPEARLVGIGDVYRDIKEMAFALHPFLDAVLLDFSTRDVLACFEDEKLPSSNLIVRKGKDLLAGPERHYYGCWDLPAPRWDLFALKRYRWPFSVGGLSATLLMDFGCPFLCAYCPSSSLAYKSRDIESVIAEARLLKSLGVRNVLFRDQTFGAHRGRTLEILGRLESERLGFSWVCSTRVDLVDANLLGRMKDAGCVGVSYGIDSVDDEILRVLKKNTTRLQVEDALKLTKSCGLKTWGTFVIGLSVDTRESIERTLKSAAKLALDHVSVRVEAQRFAADYRRDMLVKGLVPPEAMPPDTPTSISVWQGRLGVSNHDVFNYHTQFQRNRDKSR